MNITVINGDGTDYDPPKNPLAEKWEKLYPPCNTSGYSCMFCRKCPHGDYWKVPEEDTDTYNKYIQDLHQYNADHGNTYLPNFVVKKE